MKLLSHSLFQSLFVVILVINLLKCSGLNRNRYERIVNSTTRSHYPQEYDQLSRSFPAGSEESLFRSFPAGSEESLFRDGRSLSSALSSFSRPTGFGSLYRPSLFHIVKFPNDECLDATNQSGVCYTPVECKAFGGTGSTLCAKGYGTCCSISRSCNEVTAQKVVYFLNPSYPLSDMTSTYCAFTIEVRDPEVCQIKLDFLEFNIDQPTDGFCFGDRLTVTAGGLSARSIPILCGDNKDQHMFVNIPRGEEQRSASLLMQTNGIGAYKWKIRATQINCVRNPAEIGASSEALRQSGLGMSTAVTTNILRRRSSLGRSLDDDVNEPSFLPKSGRMGRSVLPKSGRMGRSLPPRSGRMGRSLDDDVNEPSFLPRTGRMMLQKFQNLFAKLKVTIPAPSGCLQYFTEPRGTISSFNFGQYLSNMDYAICIERAPTTCKITFKADDFGIDKSSGAKVSSGVGDTDCSYDYLMIPGGSFTGDSIPPTKDRFCGGFLNSIQGFFRNDPIVSKANGPIVLRFHTDNSYDQSVKAGFKITYEQSSNCEQTILDSNANTGPFTSSPLFPYTPTQVSAALSEGSLYSSSKVSHVDQSLVHDQHQVPPSPDLNAPGSGYELERTETKSRSNSKRFKF